MTIAIAVKVNDGLVLATDSAGTLTTTDLSGNTGIFNVYNNANKVFNLRKGLPLGAMTYGVGNIGAASISTLTKDFRALSEASGSPYAIDSGNYTIQDVADKYRDFMLAEYLSAYGSGPFPSSDTGLVIGGYSTSAPLSEVYEFALQNGQATPVTCTRAQGVGGILTYAQNEAVSRLIYGLPSQMADVLANNLGVPQNQILPTLQVMIQAFTIPLCPDAMPIQDAIDLAEFLVDLTIKYSRFIPGTATVGGPVEIAAITKYEGFKWIRRKHYFGSELNPIV